MVQAVLGPVLAAWAAHGPKSLQSNSRLGRTLDYRPTTCSRNFWGRGW